MVDTLRRAKPVQAAAAIENGKEASRPIGELMPNRRDDVIEATKELSHQQRAIIMPGNPEPPKQPTPALTGEDVPLNLS